MSPDRGTAQADAQGNRRGDVVALTAYLHHAPGAHTTWSACGQHTSPVAECIGPDRECMRRDEQGVSRDPQRHLACRAAMEPAGQHTPPGTPVQQAGRAVSITRSRPTTRLTSAPRDLHGARVEVDGTDSHAGTPKRMGLPAPQASRTAPLFVLTAAHSQVNATPSSLTALSSLEQHHRPFLPRRHPW